jgi:hypothetical protein
MSSFVARPLIYGDGKTSMSLKGIVSQFESWAGTASLTQHAEKRMMVTALRDPQSMIGTYVAL